MSWVEISVGEPGLTFRASPYAKCQRCRLRRPDVETVEYEGELIPLTDRDRQVLGIGVSPP
jgi:hypothetical protein